MLYNILIYYYGRLHMNKMQAGFIGFIPKGSDFFETCRKYADIGYTVCEGAYGLFREGDPAENAAKLRDMGMRVLTMGASVQGGKSPDIPDLAAKARLVGADRITMYISSASSWRFADRDELPGEEEITKEIACMEAAAKACREEGLKFIFHNHDQEFITCYNGVPLFWMIAALAPTVEFELDLAWAQYAGENPARIIRRLGSRLAALHVKDYARGDNFEYKPRRTVKVPRYTTPGTGLVDMEDCLGAAAEVGCPYAIIEQDMPYHLSTEDTVRTAYFNMKETGFVE